MQYSGCPRSICISAMLVLAGAVWAGFLVGDLDDDNRIDFNDLMIMADQWLSNGACSEVGLIAHWKLDESIEAVAADASGFGRDGVVFGELLWHPENGKIGGSLELDGFEDYIQVPGFKGLAGNAPRTCTAWVRTPEVDGDIIGWGEVGIAGGRWRIRLDADGFLRVEVGGGFATGTTFLADNIWHNIAVVFDGSTTDHIQLYVDGRSETPGAVASQVVNTTGTGDVVIGVFGNPLDCFQGQIDDVRIYDRPLSDREVWMLAQLNTTDNDCADIDYHNGVDAGDFGRLASNWNTKMPAILINEVMADNRTTLSTHVTTTGDAGLEWPDWLELFNCSSGPVDLSGWYLTDDAGNLTKWRFPPGTGIGSGKFLIVFASEKRQQDYPTNYPFVDRDGFLHTNFKLTSDGEYLALVAPDGQTVIHALDQYDLGNGEYGFGPLRPDVSYGVMYTELRYFGTPTPGRANVGGFLDYVDKPRFSLDAGFYTGPFKVVISCDTPGATIRYTTDGTEPAETGGALTYTQPVPINATTCLRARAFKPGFHPSRTRTASFLFNVSDTIKSLPVISIVGDEKKSLFEPDGIMAIVGGYYSGGVWTSSGPGSYNNPMQRGIAYERPVSVEILHADGRNDTQIDCGIRVGGSDYHRPRYTRGDNWTYNYNKFTLKLFFRESYGKNTLDHPMFEQFPVDNFKSVQLRGGHNDVYNPFVKDEFIRRLHKDMGGVAASGTLMNLFINGQYKAFYNPTERLDHDFFRTWYNSDEEWDVITQREVRNGDNVAWNNTINYFRNNNLALEANYTNAAKMLDVGDFIDYLIIQLYCANWDWPNNNWCAARGRSDEGTFRLFLWDVEGSMESSHLNLTGFDDMPSYWGAPKGLNGLNAPIPYLYRALKANIDFKQTFADHIQKHFFNDGALTEPQLRKRWLQLQDAMSAVLPGMNTYVPNTWIPQRTSIMLSKFTQQGLFPLQGPSFRINGREQARGYVAAGSQLSIVNPHGSGTVYYTLDGRDPRVPVTSQTTLVTLVAEDAPKNVLVPSAPVSSAWRGGAPFDDRDWTHGTPAVAGRTGGVGFDQQTTYRNYISYDVTGPMSGRRTSCLIRIPFSVRSADLVDFNYMKLYVRYDDGFVAYINGQEVQRANYNGTPTWNSAASASHSDSAAVVLQVFDISPHLNKLRSGDNILAIHGLNRTATDNDFLISARLDAGRNTPGSGGVSPAAQVYSAAIALDKSVHVMARVYRNSTWSALGEAVYVAGPVTDSLAISEIMYHPWRADPNDPRPEPEFIELQNTGGEAINLNLVRFTQGIDFTFGDVWLAPGEHAVLAGNRDAFEEAWPNHSGTVIGGFVGRLDNAGEKLRLVNALGHVLCEFKYDDDWYDITDGGGFALALRNGAKALSQGLVGHWKLDESVGSFAGDCSGRGRNAAVRGYTVWMPWAGKQQGALEFLKRENYLEVLDYKGILGAAPRSCTAWIKTTGANMDIVGWGPKGLPGGRWIVVVDASGRLRLEVGGGAVVGTKVVNDGRWHHVAVALNGPLTDDITLYVDGRPDAVSEMTSLAVNTQAGPNVGLGVNMDMLRYFSGLLDNVCIYDRALSAEEMALLAASADYWEDKRYWRPSAWMGGSPGADDTGIVPELGSVVINEILAHSHAMDPDWIELHNTTDTPINIGGWFLSDSKADYMKFRIADGTILDRHGYAVFYEHVHFNNTQNPGCLRPFSFSENGDKLYVRSGLDANQQITGYYDEEAFGASQTNVAFGRYQKSTGAYNFVAMSANTPNEANVYPKVGPIVISEIMYNPTQGAGYDGSEHEYVELHNISAVPVALKEYDPIQKAYVPWRFTDGIDYTFALNTTIPAAGYLVVAKNPQAFAMRYPTVTNVVGPYGGQLANEGEKLELSMPGDTDLAGRRYYIRIDRVNYNDSADWPQAADGQGQSLTRINNAEYGNDPINWQSAAPTPGQ